MCFFKLLLGVVVNISRRFFRQIHDEIASVCAEGVANDTVEEHASPEIDQSDVEDFYKAINRETSERLLKNRQDGTFIIRPSSKTTDVGILSIVHLNKIYHLNIRRRDDHFLALGTQKKDEKSFRDLNYLINYYISNDLLLFSAQGDKVATLLIPFRNRS